MLVAARLVDQELLCNWSTTSFHQESASPQCVWTKHHYLPGVLAPHDGDRESVRAIERGSICLDGRVSVKPSWRSGSMKMRSWSVVAPGVWTAARAARRRNRLTVVPSDSRVRGLSIAVRGREGSTLKLTV